MARTCRDMARSWLVSDSSVEGCGVPTGLPLPSVPPPRCPVPSCWADPLCLFLGNKAPSPHVRLPGQASPLRLPPSCSGVPTSLDWPWGPSLCVCGSLLCLVRGLR